MENNEPSSSSACNITKGDASSDVVDGNVTDSGNTGIEMSSGGYSYELVDSSVKEMKELECPICCLLMRDAQELGCHHAMCSSCLNKWGKENIEKKGCFTCPQCCVKIAMEKTIPNGIINRLITTSIKVKCGNSGKGCEWIGVICDIVLHMKNKCDFTILKCLNERCTKKVRRKLMDAHVERCLYRIINCSFCSCEVTCADQNDHLNGCEMVPVQCDNKGCLSMLPRNQITSHVQECNFKPTKCSFESIGCTIVLSPKDMEEHLIDSTNYHMNLMLLEMKTGKTELRETKTQLEKVRMENDELRKLVKENLEMKATKTELKETKGELGKVRMENDELRKLVKENLEMNATKTELKETKGELGKVRMENYQYRKLLERNLENKATKTELKHTKTKLEKVRMENDQHGKQLERNLENKATKTELKETKAEFEKVRLENHRQRKLLDSNLEMGATKIEVREIKAELMKVRMKYDQCNKLLEQNLQMKATKTELNKTKAELENVKIENDQQRKLLENVLINHIDIFINESQSFQDMERSVISMEKELLAVNNEVKDRIKKFDLELAITVEDKLQLLNDLNNSSINLHNNKIQNLVHKFIHQIINEAEEVLQKFKIKFTTVEERLVEEEILDCWLTLNERLNKCILSDWKETTYSERIAAIMEYLPENSMLMHGDRAFLKLRYSYFDNSSELIIRKSEYFNPYACRIDVDKKTVEIELPRFFYSVGVLNLFEKVCLNLKFQRKTENEQHFRFKDFVPLALYLSNGFILIHFFNGDWKNY